MVASRQGSRKRFIVLTEGRKDYHFIRGYLQERFGKRQVDITRVDVPDGLGSGEQRVRERYPRELKARRQRRLDENLWLVVMTDADSLTVEQRRRQLEEALEEKEEGPREPGERVVILTPRRNLESWMHWADGNPPDEETDFKHEYPDGPRQYEEKAAQRCQQEDTADLAPSLRAACDELDRIQP